MGSLSTKCLVEPAVEDGGSNLGAFGIVVAESASFQKVPPGNVPFVLSILPRCQQWAGQVGRQPISVCIWAYRAHSAPWSRAVHPIKDTSPAPPTKRVIPTTAVDAHCRGPSGSGRPSGEGSLAVKANMTTPATT